MPYNLRISGDVAATFDCFNNVMIAARAISANMPLILVTVEGTFHSYDFRAGVELDAFGKAA